MAADDDALAHAFGARRADIVLVHHLDDGGAQHARDHRRVAVAYGQRRPDELREVGDRVLPQRGEGDRRQPIEEVQQRQDHQHAQPERGHGEPGDGDEADDVVDPGVAQQRRDGAERQRHRHGDEHRQDGELEGELEAQPDLVDDGALRPHRFAEIERDEPDHPVAELGGERLIEAKPGALALDHVLRDIAAFAAQLELDDVAGHDAEHDEDQHGNAEQCRQCQQQAMGEIAGHAAAPPILWQAA